MRVGAAKDLSKREITRLLAKEPKIKEEEILSIAACSNQKNVLELVLSRGFDLEKLDPELKFHFFLVAIEFGITQLVEVLLEKGVDVDQISSAGSTALMIAAQYGHTETVNALLEKGADVNKETVAKPYP